MLRKYTSPVTFHTPPDGFPSFLGLAKLGDMECCYFKEESLETFTDGDSRQVAFEPSTLKIPEGFRWMSYVVENGSVRLIPGPLVVGRFKKPLLFDLLLNGGLEEHVHECKHNIICAGNNGCPRAAILARKFILFSKTVEVQIADDMPFRPVITYYLLFLFPTQEIIFHVVSEFEIHLLLKEWESLREGLPSSRKLILKLDGAIKYDDDLELFTTTGAHNSLVMTPPLQP